MAINPESLQGEDRARELVKSRYLAGEKASRKQKSNFDRWFRMYRNERVSANYQGFSNIIVPKPFEKVERGTATITQAIKRIKVNGEGPEDKQSAALNEKLIEFEERMLSIPQIRKQWIKSARIHGIAYLKATWSVSKEEPDKPWKGIDIVIPDPKSIYFNPDHTPDKPFRWAIHEQNVPSAEIEKNKQFSKAKLSDVKQSSSLGGRKDRNLLTTRTSEDVFDTTTLMVNIKEYFGPFRKNESSLEEPYYIVLANDNTVLYSAPSIYSKILSNGIPIFPMNTYVVPHEAFPMGDIEAAESLFIELNDTRNQRMDTVTLNIDPAKIVLKAAQISEADLVARKGWVIRSNIPGGVSVLPPDMQGVVASINEEKIIQGDIDRTLGIPSFGASTPVAGDITTDTATGVNAILQAQDIISGSVLEEVKSALQKFYRAILAYNQTFIDREFKISLVSDAGPESFNINPQAIAGNMDLDVEVEVVGNRLARRAEALQALQVGSKIPGSNMGKLWEDYLATHDKYNIAEYYQPPQPAPPEPPKVSVSLSGQLGGVQAASIYGTIPGVNKKFADPIMTEEGRQMIRGTLPEHQASQDKTFEQSMTQKEMSLKEKAMNAK